MRGGLRLALCVTGVLLFSLYLLEAHLQDLCNQYRAGAYLIDWLDRNGPAHRPAHGNITPGDKVIVMAKLEEEPTDWVEEQLPEYVCLLQLTSTHLINLLTAGSEPSTSSTLLKRPDPTPKSSRPPKIKAMSPWPTSPT